MWKRSKKRWLWTFAEARKFELGVGIFERAHYAWGTGVFEWDYPWCCVTWFAWLGIAQGVCVKYRWFIGWVVLQRVRGLGGRVSHITCPYHATLGHGAARRLGLLIDLRSRGECDYPPEFELEEMRAQLLRGEDDVPS